MVFTGNANPALADAIAKNIGVPLGHASIGKFSDGEVSVELNEKFQTDARILGSGEEKVTPDTFKQDDYSYITSIDI